MTEISNNFGAVTDGATRAGDTLPPAKPGAAVAPGVDPRLRLAVDDTASQTRRGRDEVAERGEKTRRYTRDMEGIQERGGRNMRSGGGGGPESAAGAGTRGGSQMPQMPQVPQQPAPQMAAPQPQMAAPPMAAPQMPAPVGVQNIDPKVLAALVAAARAQADAGGTPGLGRDPNRAVAEGSATTPQPRQPLDISEVSLEKHPGGVLSQDEVADVIDQALTINGIPNDPALREQWQQLYQHMALHESGNNPNAVNNWDCLTLDHLILTQRGWLKHDEVRIGDKTIGYNAARGRSEWTPVTRVVHYDDVPVVRMSNSRWDVTCTRNHRWLTQRRVSIGTGKASVGKACPECGRSFAETSGNGLAVHRSKAHGVRSTYSQIHVEDTATEMRSGEHLNTRDYLLLAAPADTGAGLPITDTEAEILGWIAGDGHVENRKHRPTLSIAQSKPRMVERLTELLAAVPHSLYTDDRPTRTGRKAVGPRRVWRIGYEWSRSLILRAGHPKTDAFAMILAMSDSQRSAWLRGISDAEGTVDSCGRTILTQRPGVVLDAMETALYLSGRRPRVRAADSETRPQHWSPTRQVTGNIPRLSVAGLTVHDAGQADVWCVTTGLGSWTARNDRHVFLTGNSNATGAMMEDGGRANSSRGIWQCIPSTFAAYHMAGTSNSIYDPVASAAASINYVMETYKVSPTGEGLTRFMSRQGVGGGGYQGY